MSGNTARSRGQPSAAGDVTFSSLSNRNGESSSRAESASSGYRSSYEQKHRNESETLTPHHHEEVTQKASNHYESANPRSNRNSGGFLLDSSFANGSPREDSLIDRHGKRKAQDGYLRVGKTRHAVERLSVDSSQRSSPLSREVSIDDGSAREKSTQRGSRPTSMDPAQLVQMALDLSESRKRHGSGPIQLSVPSPRAKRGVSGLNPNFGTVRSRPSAEQRAIRSSGEEPRSRISSANTDSADRTLSDASGTVQDYPPVEIPQSISPATLSRTEKARRYFELASEHRRLLQHLPPLKSDSTAPGNYTFVSTSSPGSAHAQISRVQSYSDNKHQLGRAYNPLQALRNRRLRTRERRQLTAPPEVWQDTQAITDWIDEVETATRESGFRSAPDRVRLPIYAGDQLIAADTPAPPRGHRRTDTSQSVITRPENGWNIEPAELLADTYWTEKDDNKFIMENRLGNNIFPAKSSLGVMQPRKSDEASRRPGLNQEVVRKPSRLSEEIIRNSGNVSSVEEGISEMTASKKGHQRTHLISRHHKPRTRSASVTSASSAEGRMSARRSHVGNTDVNNTGPLERHMQEMIEKDQKGELSSPELVSPDHWESKYTPFPVARDVQNRNRSGTLQRDNATLSINTQLHHRRAKSADGRVGGSPRVADSPAGSTDSPKFFPSSKADLTPPVGNPPSHLQREVSHTPSEHKSKLHRLPLFRHHSKEPHNIERTDFAAIDENRLSVDLSRSSQESARPSFVQRHKTTDSFTSSLRRHGTSTTETSGKDSAYGVGRFLKGVRHEGSRLSDRLRNKDRVESESQLADLVDETESDVEPDSGPPQAIDDDNEPSPRTSIDRGRAKPKYFLSNLPSFRASNGRSKLSPTQTPLPTNGSDPIGRQQRAQKEAGRSSRFDRLAPPRINLPDDDENASIPEDITENPNVPFDDRRKSYGFLGNGSKAISRTSVVSYDSQQHVGRTKSGSGEAYGRRHWSISDRLQQPKQSNKVTRRDVARVRALLLSSGVKAREIQRQADTARDTPLHICQQAAELTGHALGSPTRKDELMVAARMLSSNIDSSIVDHERYIDNFLKVTAKDLGSRLGELQRKAVEELTKLLHETSDEADAFTVELTTKGPQDVKRVDDGIDHLLRQRNRQFRLLRRAGFKLLEWLVLGIMWWVWLIVVVFNTVRRTILGIFGLVKWLLTF